MILHRVLRAPANPAVYLGALVAALIVVVAYQMRPTYDVQIGTDTDTPLLQGFNSGERTTDKDGLPYSTYRWTTGNAQITLQDVGSQDFDVALSLNGTRPPGQPAPTLRITGAGRTFLNVQPTPGVADYSFRAPRDAVKEGTLALNLIVNPFNAKGDVRELGVIVTRLKVSPAPGVSGFIVPPIAPMFGVVGAVALLGVILSVLGWGVGGVGVGAGIVCLFAARLLVFDRLWLTTRQWYFSWLQALALGAALVLLAWIVGGWLLRRGGVRWTAEQRRALLTVILAAFVARLAGQLHPEIFVWDLGFHANRLHLVERGYFLFTTTPAEFGGFGHETFYLPTPYLFVIPLKWLLGDELMAMRVLMVALGTLGAVPLFYIATRVLQDGRAGVIAALLYVTFPMAVLPYSWGIMPNVFGEFFALCALAIAVGAYSDLNPKSPAFYVLVGVLLVGLLSHTGVLALLAVAFTAMSLLWLLSKRIVDKRGAAWALGALALAAAVAFMLYYRNFLGDMFATISKIQAERTGEAASELRIRVGGSVSDKNLGLVITEVDSWRDWFFGGLRGFWNEAQAYYRVWPLPAAILGYVLTWPTFTRKTGTSSSFRIPQILGLPPGRQPIQAFRTRLVLAAVGWAFAVIVFALIGWATNLYVRYALFALPVLALGTGILLSRVWDRGWAGKWVSLSLLAFFTVQALALWQYRITYGFK